MKYTSLTINKKRVMINGDFCGNHNIKSAVGGTMTSYLLTLLLEIKG